MARAGFGLEYDGVDKLIERMQQFGTGSGQIVDGVLHQKAGRMIDQAIMMILPVSGRTWKGKKTAASRTKPFQQTDGSLSVTIRSKTPYNYLYFPDDGSNTKKHRGDQQFMKRGAENEKADIIDLCISALLDKFEGR